MWWRSPRLRPWFLECNLPKEVRPDSGTEQAEEPRVPRYGDMQSAVRFPLRLPIAFHSQSGDQEGETRNISANGVLFQADAEMPVGSSVEFTIAMPSQVLGSPADVLVNCRGRIVRSFEENNRRWVGVVIDEYGITRVDDDPIAKET